MSACFIASYRRRSMSAIACSIGVFHASQPAWTTFIEAAQIERMLLVGAWINEDIEPLDTAVLNMGDVSPRHGHGAIRRTRTPEQPRGAVVAHSMSRRGEHEVGWQPEEQIFNGLRDRAPSGCDGLGIVKNSALGIQFAQRYAPAVRIAFVEDSHYISLHQRVELAGV